MKLEGKGNNKRSYNLKRRIKDIITFEMEPSLAYNWRRRHGWPVKVTTPAAASRLVEARVTGYPLIVCAA
jgi:hypothetical protein